MTEQHFGALLPSFGDSDRIWTFVFDQPISDGFLVALQTFLESWRAHGASVPSEAVVVRNRVLVVAAEPTVLSGCGIDSLFQAVKELSRAAGLELLPSSSVFFEEQGELVQCQRTDFATRVGAGQITPSTLVLDLSAQTVGDLRSGRWLRPFGTSWHAKAFPLPL